MDPIQLDSVPFFNGKPLLSLSIHYLYNWIQDAAIQKLIIDTRPTEVYDAGYVKTAISIPISKDEEVNLQELDKTLTPKNMVFKSRGLVYTHIVVYDEGDGSIALKLVEALARESKAEAPHVLQGGYVKFAGTYPFLCSTALKKVIAGSYPSEILHSFLYLGSSGHAKSKQQLTDLGITHILNMAGELPNEFPEDFTYLKCDLDDTSADSVADYLERSLSFIEGAKGVPTKVLVHCAMGISRSSSVVIAYLMRERSWTYAKAFQYVKSMRSCIRPNPAFVVQLSEFEQKLAEKNKLEDTDTKHVPKQMS